MITKKLLSMLAATLILLSTAACNSGNDGSSEYTAMVFVTNNGIVNGKNSFTYYAPDSDTGITIYSTESTADLSKYAIGERIIIAFNIRADEVISDGSDIELIATSKLSSSGKVVPETVPQDWNATTGFYLQSVTRSGAYLDIMGLAPTSGVTFKIIADPTTLDSECPQLYLIYSSTATNAINNGQFLASYDMTEIWNDPRVQRVSLNVNNSNQLTLGQFQFEKSKK